MLAQTGALPIMKSNDNPVYVLQTYFSSSMEKVDQITNTYLESPVPLVGQVATHLIKAGGKRLRPLLTLAATHLFNPNCKESAYLAAAVEFIHTATLLHDDVIDVSNLRRGEKTANALWGNQASILVGDFLFAQSFNLMIQCNNLETLSILSKASAIIAEGEVFQLSVLNNLHLSIEDHLKIIGAKTAELFAAACQSGACLAGAPLAMSNALYNYGHNLGIAFQLIDDILDYTASSITMGKDVGDDFKEGKITLPVLFALKTTNVEETCFWHRTLVERDQDPSDFSKALELIKKYNGFTQAYDLAYDYSQEAIQNLIDIPSSPLKSCLIHLASDALNRQW